MKTAVIVTTYNRPDALAAVLAGYCNQSDLDFELLFADDGSTDDTRKLIEYGDRALSMYTDSPCGVPRRGEAVNPR